MKYTIMGILFFICLIFGTVWVVQGNQFFLMKVFAPAEEQVRRETFEQSKAYNQGMIQEIQNMQFQYIQANKDQKDALASIILHRVADFDLDKMPSDLKSFVLSLKNRGNSFDER